MKLPSIPEPFYWTSEPWGPALRCRALDPIASHLFTTRQLPLPADVAWEQLAQALGVPSERLLRLKQVHGRHVVVVRRGEADLWDGERPEADAIATADPEAAIAVQSADCVPVLMADPKTGAVAAVHAGWRGTAARAAMAAVDALEREFGASPSALVAAIGPSIGSCCYEVGSELVDAFAAAGHERYLIDRWFLSPPSRGAARPRLRLDLWTANRDQLILAGLRGENVHVAGLCTADYQELLPSYRSERERAGRMAGVIRARGVRI